MRDYQDYDIPYVWYDSGADVWVLFDQNGHPFAEFPREVDARRVAKLWWKKSLNYYDEDFYKNPYYINEKRWLYGNEYEFPQVQVYIDPKTIPDPPPPPVPKRTIPDPPPPPKRKMGDNNFRRVLWKD